MQCRKTQIAISAVLLSMAIIVALGIIAAIHRWRQRSLVLGCFSNMMSMMHRAEIWAEDHGNKMPSSFSHFCRPRPVLFSLLCPCDPRSELPQAENRVNVSNSSYEIVSPGMNLFDTNTPFIRCKACGTVAFTGHRFVLGGCQDSPPPKILTNISSNVR